MNKTNLKLAILTLIGTAGVATIATTSVFISKLHQERKTYNYAAQKMLDGFKLFPGTALAEKLNVTLASKFINKTDRLYHTTLTSFSDSYDWNKILSTSNITTLDELESNDLYLVNPDNGSLLNALETFKYKVDTKTGLRSKYPQFAVVIKSYANDILGELLLKIEVKRSTKSGEPISTIASKVYKLEGFAKVSSDNLGNAVLYLDDKNVEVAVNTSAKTKYASANELQSAYDKVKDNLEQKELFLKDLLSFATSNYDEIDFKNFDLKISQGEQDSINLNLHFVLKIAVSSATETQLNKIELPLTKEFEFTLKYLYGN
ncbi:MAG1430 family protein [Mycoplasma buteonis]|uniref:MAG1430 family protein n=1 Tax=Mycoplasma buteonis TaxID=171280 RepID=UPI0005655A1F|nr:hypothetical protein [Mycoplasma buteonis]